MNGDKDLKSILDSTNLTEEQRMAIMDAVNNNNKTKTPNKKATSNVNVGLESKNLTIIDRPTVKSDYVYKDIPCNCDIFRIFYLADTNMILNKNSNLLGAFLLKWINEGKIKYNYVTRGLFKKSSYVIEINPTLKFSDEYENEIFKFIKRACDGDNILTDKEFKKYAEKRQFELQTLLDEICEYEEAKLVSAGLLTVDVTSSEEKHEDTNNPLNTEGIIVKNTRTKMSNSKELENDIKNIIGFKSYMKTLNGTPDLSLPNDYYVVTELLGISNYVSQNFNEVYPEFYFRHLQFLHHLRNSHPAATSALNKMIDISKMQVK